MNFYYTLKEEESEEFLESSDEDSENQSHEREMADVVFALMMK